MKSRPLREIGAEQARGTGRYLDALYDTTLQLLIDLGVLKACLLRLPGEALSSSG